MRRFKRVLITLVAVALIPACSFEASVGDSGLDMGKIEDEILNGIEEQTDVDIESVECPDEMDQEEGLNFECTATPTDGEPVQVRVVQTDGDGNIEWEVIE